MDEDNQKRNEIIQKRSEAWKKHTWNQYTMKDNRRKAQKNTVEQMEQNGTNGTVNVNDNDNVNDNVNVNDNEIINQTEFDEISNEISDFTQKQIETVENNWKQLIIKSELWIEEKEKNSAKKEKEYWSHEINELIEELKITCDEMGIAYDQNDERNFARHILTAKAFWIMSDKLWQTRKEFAKNILIASVKIWFWKWPCAWPKKIYQNFAEVFNDTIKQKNKNSIPQF